MSSNKFIIQKTIFKYQIHYNEYQVHSDAWAEAAGQAYLLNTTSKKLIFWYNFQIPNTIF